MHDFEVDTFQSIVYAQSPYLGRDHDLAVGAEQAPPYANQLPRRDNVICSSTGRTNRNFRQEIEAQEISSSTPIKTAWIEVKRVIADYGGRL